MNTADAIVDRVMQDERLCRAVDSIMTEPMPSTWTRADQTSLVWSTLALAYTIGKSDGADSMGEALQKAIAA